MSAQVLALLGAFFFASNHILVKKGLLAGATPTVCTIINIASNAVLLWILAAFLSPLAAIAAPRALIFVLVGILVPGLARMAFFIGIDRLGVSRATAMSGVAPIFSSIAAIVLLSEWPDLLTALGTLCIVAGIVALSVEREKRITWKRTDLLFPVGSAMLLAARDNLARFAFGSWPHPLLAAAIATGAATFFIFAINARNFGGDRLTCSRTSFLYFIASGMAAGLSYLCFFAAFSLAPVVQVAPLLYTVNILTIAMAYLFLRETELLTKRVGVSALIIFAGIVLITAF